MAKYKGTYPEPNHCPKCGQTANGHTCRAGK